MVHTALRRALTAALKARDQVALSALRSALAAIENASAVDAPRVAPRTPALASGPIAGALTGLGAAEVARRVLTADEERALVEAEVRQRLSAASQYAEMGRADRAERLRAEAAVLAEHLGE